MIDIMKVCDVRSLLLQKFFQFPHGFGRMNEGNRCLQNVGKSSCRCVVDILSEEIGIGRTDVARVLHGKIKYGNSSLFQEFPFLKKNAFGPAIKIEKLIDEQDFHYYYFIVFGSHGLPEK